VTPAEQPQQLEDAWGQCPPGSYEQRALALLRSAAAMDRHYIELQQQSHADRRLLEKCRHVLNGVASQIVSHDRVYRPLVDEIDHRFGTRTPDPTPEPDPAGDAA
jgi:hypothetical protein